MKISKTISQFRLFAILFLILSIIFALINLNQPSKYSINEKEIIGTVYQCEENKEKTVLQVKGKENILINYYGKYKCKLGTKILAHGKIQKPSSNTNFYLFNYKNYLLSKKIHYTFTATNIKTIGSNIPFIYKIKNHLKNHIKNYKSKAYLDALVLGNNSSLEENVKESYQTNGISHLLAISGAQITLFTSFLLYIFNKTFSKINSYTITIVLLIFYLFITDFQPSILRATIFFIILTINKQLELKIDTLSLLLITASFLLFTNPFYIYSLGFLLSFVISFYLILFKQIIHRQKTYLSKNLTISLIAFLASAPIIINSFFKLNLLSPLINLYFVPLMSFIIYPLSLLTFIFKPLDLIFYNVVNIMENASLILAKVTFLNFTLRHLNVYFFIFYYFLITYLLYYKQKGKNCLYVFFLILIIHHNINYFNPISSLIILDVGQGDCLLLKLNHNQGNILIDTGGQIRWDDKKPYNISKNITIPYLQAEGISQLDYLITTHGDFDHIGEAMNLVNDFPIKNVIFNQGKYNNLETELIKLLKQKNIKYYNNIQELNFSNNKLLFLNNKNYDNENENSSIIYTEIENVKLLLMGDASSKNEEDILTKYNLQNIDILKVGHHGSKTSSSQKFIEKISPKYSLISVGKNNNYGHPNKETLNNLSKSTIYRTDQNGSIKLKITNKLEIKTCITY